jgi:hypothetical protein
MWRNIPKSSTRSSSTAIPESRDVFICHASEDKEAVARLLATELRGRGFTVWYDEFDLTLGDPLPTEIERGLASRRFGVVILSPDFYAKNWPQGELDGLDARKVQHGKKVILPGWHNVTAADVEQYSPTVAAKLMWVHRSTALSSAPGRCQGVGPKTASSKCMTQPDQVRDGPTADALYHSAGGAGRCEPRGTAARLA